MRPLLLLIQCSGENSPMHSSAAKDTSVIEYSECIVLAYLVKFDDMWMVK